MTTVLAGLSDDVAAVLWVAFVAIAGALVTLALLRGGHPRSRRP